ncbi:hypothetical protein ACFL6E_07390 [Candidatus Neomarinimicrobiota bacterium]
MRNLDDGEQEIVDAHVREVLERAGWKVIGQSLLTATVLTAGSIILLWGN